LFIFKTVHVFALVGLLGLIATGFIYIGGLTTLGDKKTIQQLFIIIALLFFIGSGAATLLLSSAYLDKIATPYLRKSWVHAILIGILVAILSLLLTSLSVAIAFSCYLLVLDVLEVIYGISDIKWKNILQPILAVPFWVMLFGTLPSSFLGLIYGITKYYQLKSSGPEKI
jgi:hypothetical protein